MTPEQQEHHIRHLAHSHCRAKHQEVYNAGINTNASGPLFGSPCEDCLVETRQEYEMKRGKMAGTLLTPEEAAEVRRKLGIKE